MQLRPLRAGEWRRYREIRLAALRDAPSAFAGSLAAESALSDAEWRARARGWAAGEDRLLYVAVAPDGSWAGMAGIYRPGPPPADAEVVSMWVAPAARRTGLGRRLLDAVVGWAAAGGAGVVGLWVVRQNAGAIALYTRAGFRPNGDTQPLPSDPCKEELRMLRAVEPAPH